MYSCIGNFTQVFLSCHKLTLLIYVYINSWQSKEKPHDFYPMEILILITASVSNHTKAANSHNV